MDRTANISHDLLTRAIDESRDGIIIADAQKQGFPLIYANKGFEKLAGYSAEEVVGKSFYFLLGKDTEQPEVYAINAAIAKNDSCEVTIRNYRKDGSMFWNEISVSPLHNADSAPTHFIVVQHDVTARMLLEQQHGRIDPVAGINNRQYFDQRLTESLAFSRRAHSGMSLLIIELDCFSQFGERYGQAAENDCLHKVGDCITAMFVRSSDCAARLGGAEFSIVSLSFGAGSLRQHAQKLCEQVRRLNIPNSDSPHGAVTISIGGAHYMPKRETTEEMLIGVANSKLLAAKRNGGNCALVIG